MLVLIAALIVAAAVGWTGTRLAAAVASPGKSGGPADRQKVTEIFGLFAPGMAAVAEDPRALLVWQPMAVAARQLFPTEFAVLDVAFGRTFPFTLDQLQASHARWTTDWLGWERTHDGDFKLKAAAIEEELGERAASPYGRTRLEAVEREKLERYQRRYEEYTRTSRGLQSLIVAATPPPAP
jgi:hypothetical protein